MRIALVGAEIEENLGLRYLAAALRRARHEAVIVPFDHGGEIAHVGKFVSQGGFDLVGLGMMFQLRGREFCALAERIRAEGFRGAIVGGGQWATFMAREILAANHAIDAIVLGEGEGAIVEIAGALAESAGSRTAALAGVRGLVLRTDDGAVVATQPRTDRVPLGSLAPPVRDVPRRHLGLPAAQLVSSRGCYADCSFCSINAWEKLSGGPKRRQRDPADVAEEMAALHHERGVRVFNFHDDNFWLPTPKASRARIDAIARELARRGVKNIALLLKCRPNDVDRDLFVACKELGLVRVYVGVETDAPAGLATLRRGVSQAQNQRALDVLEALDLHVCSNLLLFDPDTTLRDVPLNIGFYERNAHHTLNFSRVEAYGGTPLTARLAREGRLSGDYLGFDYAMADPKVELLWRICHLAFHERNFPAEGLANSVIGLGYRLRLAKRFWPSPEIERLGDLAIDFVVRFGRSQARHLRMAHALVSTCDPTDRDFATMFAIDLSRAIREEDAQLGPECDALIAAIEAYAERRRAGGGARPVDARGAPGWLHTGRLAVGVALATAACGPSSAPTTLPPPPLPPVAADGGVVVTPPVTPPGLADADGRVGAVVAHVALSPGRTTRFGPRDEGGRYDTLTGDATITGVGSESYELLGVTVEPSVARVSDPFVASTGRSSHFTITVAPEQARDAAAVVRASFRHAAGGPPISATATFRTYEGGKLSIGLPVVPATPPYVVCDPAAAPQLTAVNDDRAVHIGAEQHRWSGAPHPITASYSTAEVTAWLDESVQGTLASPPTATIGGGQVRVNGPTRTWNGQETPRSFTMTVDPRNPDGRLASGSHTLTVTFTVLSGGRPHPFSASVPVRIEDGGLMVIGPPAAPPQFPLQWPGLPLERRFAASIVAQPEEDGLVLAVQADARDPAAAYLWRASAGELVAGAHSPRAVWVPPRTPGRHVVTCAVQTDEPGLAIATYVHEVGES